MGIVDYSYLVAKFEKDLFNKDTISDINKKYLKDFLIAYDVSPARKSIFLKQIVPLLEMTKDLKKEMIDSSIINPIFRKLRDSRSPAYYTSNVSCSLRLVRWLNNEERPIGFKDIKNLSKANQKRDLKPNDMLTWEDGLEMMKHTPSTQMKAIIAVQLSSGLRPGEFIDLKYGDIEQKRHYLIAHVKGKTGSRAVIIDKGSPFLNTWLNDHPHKENKSPLWIIENPRNSIKKRAHFDEKYTYEAIAKRIRHIGKIAGIKKPLDFYNFRHSCAVLMSKWNIPVETRAKNMGHSVKMHVETYGRLSLDDELESFDRANGITLDEEKAKANHVCKICSTINESHLTHCKKCNSPLSLEVALKSEQDTKEQLDDLKTKMLKLEKALELISMVKN